MSDTLEVKTKIHWHEALKAVSFLSMDLKPEEVCESDAEYLEQSARRIRTLLARPKPWSEAEGQSKRCPKCDSPSRKVRRGPCTGGVGREAHAWHTTAEPSTPPQPAPPDSWRNLPQGAWFFCDSPNCTNRYSIQERTSSGWVLVCSRSWHHDKANRDMQEIAETHNARMGTAEPVASVPQPPAQRKKANHVGAPAIFALEQACRTICEAFDGFGCYLVGSALERPDWRDVDLRYIMADEDFAKLFPNAGQYWEQDARWLLLTVSISERLSKLSDLPVDFQIQPQTHANERHKGPRHSIGLKIKAQDAAQGGACEQETTRQSATELEKGKP